MVNFIRDLDPVPEQEHIVQDYRTQRSASTANSKPGSLGSIDLFTAEHDHERLANYNPAAKVAKKHRYRSGLGSVLSRKPATVKQPDTMSSDTL